MVQAVWSTAHGHPLRDDRPARRPDLAARRARRPDPRRRSRRSGGSGRARTCCSSCRRSRSRSARCPSSGSPASTSARERAALGFALAYLLYPADRLADAERVPSGRARDAAPALRLLVPRRGPAPAVRGLRDRWRRRARRRSRSSSPASASGTRSRTDAGLPARRSPASARAWAAVAIEVVIPHFNARRGVRLLRALQRGRRLAGRHPQDGVHASAAHRRGGVQRARPPLPARARRAARGALPARAARARRRAPGARDQPALVDDDADVDPLPLHRGPDPAARRSPRSSARSGSSRWAAAGRAPSSSLGGAGRRTTGSARSRAGGMCPAGSTFQATAARRHGARPDRRRARSTLIPRRRRRQRDEHARRAPVGAAARPQLPVPRGRDSGSPPTRRSPATRIAMRRSRPRCSSPALRRNPEWQLVFEEDGILVFRRAPL